MDFAVPLTGRDTVVSGEQAVISLPAKLLTQSLVPSQSRVQANVSVAHSFAAGAQFGSLRGHSQTSPVAQLALDVQAVEL